MNNIYLCVARLAVAKRLHTAVLALLSALFSMRCIGISSYHPRAPWAAFFIVWGVYLENILTDTREDKLNKPRAEHCGNTLFKIESLYPLSYLAGLTLALSVNRASFFFALFATAVFLCYGRACVPKKGRLVRAKEVFILKNIVPAAGWVISTAVIPFAGSGAGYIPECGILLIVIFLFSVREEIKFDIPDVKGDAALHIRTIPNAFGEKTTRYILASLSVILTALLLTAMASLYEHGRRATLEPLLRNILPFFAAFSLDAPFIDLLFLHKSKTHCDFGIIWWIFLLSLFMLIPYPYNTVTFIAVRTAGILSAWHAQHSRKGMTVSPCPGQGA